MADGRERLLDSLDVALGAVDARYAAAYPGLRAERQPVHTVYVPVDRYDADTVRSWGAQAQDTFSRYVSGAEDLADIVGIEPTLAREVLPLVEAKLAAEPIEDLRIDFEDGFPQAGIAPGGRDADEDTHLVRAARALRATPNPTPFSGIRVKCLEPAVRARAVRTMDMFLAEIADNGSLPAGFVVTLPKVTAPEQVAAMVTVCEYLESTHGLTTPLRFEIQIETPQSVCGPDGTAQVASMIHAAQGRCSGLHYGTYDYSAACGIAAEYQAMDHPVADHAKATMQVAAAGTGVLLSDGSTNRLPVGTADEIRAAWSLHARLVDRSLRRGFYQGWDLHPAQLPTRYAATFAFYRRSFASAAVRISTYLARTEGGFLDEPATVRALASFLHRGLECGALTDSEVRERAGVTPGRLGELAGFTRQEGHFE
ncbi:DUF6986 family protein [Rhodococcus coprophilus]|uniref:DUF6986 family protein n=1 Tax=Rhodococcus coprophilus TaxID=38310 RepID=UPI0037A24D85